MEKTAESRDYQLIPLSEYSEYNNFNLSVDKASNPWYNVIGGEEMRITRLKDIDELNELRDKLEAVFSKEFTDKEKVAMLDLAENSDELFWEIMFEAIEKS